MSGLVLKSPAEIAISLMAELTERRRRVLDEFGPESLLPGFFGGMAFDALRARTVAERACPSRAAISPATAPG